MEVSASPSRLKIADGGNRRVMLGPAVETEGQDLVMAGGDMDADVKYNGNDVIVLEDTDAWGN